MAGETNETFPTSQQPPEVSRSPFIETFRNILERDPVTSPFTPAQSAQTLEESRHILTRAYANQLGISPIDYGLPRQQRHNSQLTIVTQDLEITGNTPHHQVERHQRQITQTNTAKRLIAGGGFDQPPSPLESPPDSPRPSDSGISSSSERSPMAGNVPVGGGNPPPNPPNPQLPWLRTAAVVVPGIQHPLPKHLDKLLPKFNPDDKEPA